LNDLEKLAGKGQDAIIKNKFGKVTKQRYFSTSYKLVKLRSVNTPLIDVVLRPPHYLSGGKLCFIWHSFATIRAAII